MTKYFGDKNCKKREVYTHTPQGFLQFLAQKMKSDGLIELGSIELCFGIVLINN